ncbi:uncharacterized protein [Dendrobates tinctorius]|uniref:uncharacterized protein n=1 Tax=Dendrobates tinctorius TaxID=92724 RepID=UPI003CC971CE
MCHRKSTFSHHEPGGVPRTQTKKSGEFIHSQIRVGKEKKIEISKRHRGLPTKQSLRLVGHATTFQTPHLPKLIWVNGQSVRHHQQHHLFFRAQSRPHKRKTRRGGQCYRGQQNRNRVEGDDQITGKAPLVINISSKNLSSSQLTVLQKGLSFCPSYKFDFFELDMDLQRFFRNLRLKTHFARQPHRPIEQVSTSLLQLTNLGLRTRSTFMPPKGNPPIETFISLVERDIEIFHREVNQGKFHHHTNLSREERMALDDLSSDRSLVIKPANKGGSLVIMDRSDYLSEIHRQLSDREVYMPIAYNPLDSIINKIKPIIQHHIGVGTIDKTIGDFLLNSDPITPVFYVLPKIHKRLEKPPGRPIVSSTNSILSPPAMFLEKILTPLVKTTKSYLKDTNEFISLIKSLGSLPSSSFLVTWDVNSLYTSITHEKGLRAIEILMVKADMDSRIRNLCLDLLKLVLKENYFLFQDTFYIQKQGTAMGSHVAPPYAIAYMASFEEDHVDTHPLYKQHSLIWLRFIDDIFCVWNGPLDTLIQFDHHINNIWPELKFSLQYDKDRMNFLDTLINKTL